jgi:hypothetical protein
MGSVLWDTRGNSVPAVGQSRQRPNADAQSIGEITRSTTSRPSLLTTI